MRRDYYFIFNGKNSKDMGIEIVEFPPITKAQRNIQSVSIPGKSNNLNYDSYTYNPYTFSVACCINSFKKNKQTIDNIAAWLDGFGELILSQEPDKIYDVVIKNSIDFKDVIWLFPQFVIQFEVQPFKKSVNFASEIMEINKKTIINNIGTVPSLPQISIYGTGDITLKINNIPYFIKGIEDYITIDSEFLEVYKDDLNQNNKYNNFDFPFFGIGKNEIDFIGDIEKIIIKPNWRWI